MRPITRLPAGYHRCMTTRGTTLGRAAALGALSGVIGAGVMAGTEKLEQAFTHRPNSFVPGRAMMRLLGRPAPDDAEPVVSNLVMHYGTGAVVGAVRGIWAAVGMRGPRANLAHTVFRLSTDQSIENGTGVGAPPHTWPVVEQAVDVTHKSVYSWTTGLLADRLIEPALQSERGRTSH